MFLISSVAVTKKVFCMVYAKEKPARHALRRALAGGRGGAVFLPAVEHAFDLDVMVLDAVKKLQSALQPVAEILRVRQRSLLMCCEVQSKGESIWA